MPSFIKDVILSRPIFTIAYYAVIFLFFCIAVFFIFVFNEFFIQKKDTKTAIKNSINIVKGNFIKLILVIGLTNIAIYIIGIIAALFIDKIIIYVANLSGLGYKSISIISILQPIVQFIGFLKVVFIATIMRWIVYSHYKRHETNIPSDWHKIQTRNLKGKTP